MKKSKNYFILLNSRIDEIVTSNDINHIEVIALMRTTDESLIIRNIIARMTTPESISNLSVGIGQMLEDKLLLDRTNIESASNYLEKYLEAATLFDDKNDRFKYTRTQKELERIALVMLSNRLLDMATNEIFMHQYDTITRTEFRELIFQDANEYSIKDKEFISEFATDVFIKYFCQ